MDGSQHDGAFAGMVPGCRGILLVGRIMFLCHHNKTQVPEGQKQCASRSNYQTRFPRPQLLCHCLPPARGEATVVCEGCLREGIGLAQFGRQHQHAPALVQDFPCQLQEHIPVSHAGKENDLAGTVLPRVANSTNERTVIGLQHCLRQQAGLRHLEL